jgi:SAM-dependent methyltransferase
MKKLISLIIRYVPRKYLQRVGGAVVYGIGLFYRGNTVRCPICETGFRKFLPYGRVNPRSQALCPSCLSLERHRLIWLFLKSQTSFFTEKKSVLHIAPEACFIPRFEKIHGEGYLTADIESPLAKVKMDIHNIPFADQTFDVVLCNHVLEHVQDDRTATREIFRVLKPGGLAILQVPFFFPLPEQTEEDATITDPREREKRYGQADHVRKYGKDYAERLRASGLKVTEDDFTQRLSAADRHTYGITPGEVLYHATR